MGNVRALRSSAPCGDTNPLPPPPPPITSGALPQLQKSRPVRDPAPAGGCGPVETTHTAPTNIRGHSTSCIQLCRSHQDYHTRGQTQDAEKLVLLAIAKNPGGIAPEYQGRSMAEPEDRNEWRCDSFERASNFSGEGQDGR